GVAVKELNPQEFSTKVHEPGVVTLDIRTPDEFADAHIPGAINISLDNKPFTHTFANEISNTFKNKVSKLDRSKGYAVYCHFGRRSDLAVLYMKKVGFKHLFHLQNGIVNWIGQGLPVTTT
ncbi:MAG: rhodanese-like domain-containing protein, partial [Actinomycetota bacterium]